jgi:hypothetical protein
LAELVRLHHGEELARLGIEEHRVEAGTRTGDGVGLEAQSLDLGGAGEHDVQAASGQGDAAAGAVRGAALGMLAQDLFYGV